MKESPADGRESTGQPNSDTRIGGGVGRAADSTKRADGTKCCSCAHVSEGCRLSRVAGRPSVATSAEYRALQLWPANDANTFEVIEGKHSGSLTRDAARTRFMCDGR